MLASSRPVVIPIKTKAPSHRRPLALGSSRSANKHERISPSVAAILAGTSITPPPAFRKKALQTRRSNEKSELSSALASPQTTVVPNSLELDSIFQEDLPLSLPRSSSYGALSTLLSPPEDDSPFTTGSLPGSLLSLRSTSSDSVPSLTGDDESGSSSCSGPGVSSYPRKTLLRKEKILSSPPENSAEDHPLLHLEEEDYEEYFNRKAEKPLTSSTFQRADNKESSLFSKLPFKSNLTASLRVLKSAAKSFSNLSAPMIQPEDFLTRSILSISPQYNTDERRPTFIEAPTPALRRYLNPRTANGSKDAVDVDNCIVSIQLQTYKSTFRPSEVNDPFDEMAADLGNRPREIRENSDFLRIICLEMNMRREGKLSDSAQGKARFILPPRTDSRTRPVGDASRWNPLVYE